MIEAFNYTDLQAVFTIDPAYCTGTLYAAFEPSTGTKVEVATTSYNTTTGEVFATISQSDSVNLYGIVAAQLNGIKGGKRWASEKFYFEVGKNIIDRVVTS